MSDIKEEKFYTAQEVAVKVLEKAHEMMKKSEIFKSNTAHEVEAGEEPKNDDSECPEYLADADIENDGAHGEKEGKKKKGAEGDKHSEEPEHEEGMEPEEEKEHDAEENEADEKDDDKIEADEEKSGEDEEKEDDADMADQKKIINDAAKEKKPFEKSEKIEKMEHDSHDEASGGGCDVCKLKSFMERVEGKRDMAKMSPEDRAKADAAGEKRMATPQESPEVADRAGEKRMATPKEKGDMKAAKNRKMEKTLGIQKPVAQQKPQQPPKDPKDVSGMKGY
jgi:hypothetical protein